ncbi:hypothetical protein BV22DRAFT_775318 [Leucogyrophana mollusca]|uniref:Uncharacterized protein n=1 Tax=Leucogyrophana mollusca TaxID=85980 RepID=A0ACB8B7G0_9AGAM|nr:hypothetical protein BV22DRAFT_775318 [Leucogyrophana mollusca]
MPVSYDHYTGALCRQVFDGQLGSCLVIAVAPRQRLKGQLPAEIHPYIHRSLLRAASRKTGPSVRGGSLSNQDVRATAGSVRSYIVCFSCCTGNKVQVTKGEDERTIHVISPLSLPRWRISASFGWVLVGRSRGNKARRHGNDMPTPIKQPGITIRPPRMACEHESRITGFWHIRQLRFSSSAHEIYSDSPSLTLDPYTKAI